MIDIWLKPNSKEDATPGASRKSRASNPAGQTEARPPRVVRLVSSHSGSEGALPIMAIAEDSPAAPLLPWMRLLLRVASIYNLWAGLVMVVFYHEASKILGMPRPTPIMPFQLDGLLVGLFGVGYWLVAQIGPWRIATCSGWGFGANCSARSCAATMWPAAICRSLSCRW